MRNVVACCLLVTATVGVGGCGRSNDGDQQRSVSTEETISSLPSGETDVGSLRPAVFGACAMCHSEVKDQNRLGPSLHGVVGRRAGTLTGFTFSPAMKASGLTWDEATLDRFIEDPHATAPGTRMSYAGMKDPGKRAEIIRYLATLK